MAVGIGRFTTVEIHQKLCPTRRLGAARSPWWRNRDGLVQMNLAEMDDGPNHGPQTQPEPQRASQQIASMADSGK